MSICVGRFGRKMRVYLIIGTFLLLWPSTVIQRSDPRRSISSAKNVMSSKVTAELWRTRRKKLGRFPRAVYVIIMLPDLTIRSLILGATWFQKEKGKKKKKTRMLVEAIEMNIWLSACQLPCPASHCNLPRLDNHANLVEYTRSRCWQTRVYQEPVWILLSPESVAWSIQRR